MEDSFPSIQRQQIQSKKKKKDADSSQQQIWFPARQIQPPMVKQKPKKKDADSSQQQIWFPAREIQPLMVKEKPKKKNIKNIIPKKQPKASSPPPPPTKDSILQEMWEKLQIATFFPKFSYALFKQLMTITPNHQKMKLSRHHDITKDRLEFLGDRVLKIIHGRIAFEYTETSGDATRLIMMLESNRVFACYLEKLNNICTNLGKDTKSCADLFEVLVGAIFYTYFYIDLDYQIIHKIEQWMQQVTLFSQHLRGIIDSGLKQDVLCKP